MLLWIVFLSTGLQSYLLPQIFLFNVFWQINYQTLADSVLSITSVGFLSFRNIKMSITDFFKIISLRLICLFFLFLFLLSFPPEEALFQYPFFFFKFLTAFTLILLFYPFISKLWFRRHTLAVYSSVIMWLILVYNNIIIWSVVIYSSVIMWSSSVCMMFSVPHGTARILCRFVGTFFSV